MNIPITYPVSAMFWMPNIWAAPGPGFLGIPDAPNVTLEYDWKMTLPSANDECDGHLHIFAWLHMTDRMEYDSVTTLVVDRLILPQCFDFEWMLDTHFDHEIEDNECDDWAKGYNGGVDVDVKGYRFNHTREITIAPDPPDDDGEKQESRTTFRWRRKLIDLANVQPGLLHGAVQLGIGSKDYSATVHWIIDLETNLQKYDGFIQESAEHWTDPSLADDIFSYVNTNDATYVAGKGPNLFSAGREINDRVEVS